MKKLTGILFALLFMLSPAKAQLTQAQVLADINSMLLSCGNGCNTAATLRALLDIMVQATFQVYPAAIVPTASPFNCVGDGVADDTACMQSALNSSVSNGVPLLVGFNNTKYLITSPLSTSGVVHIEGFSPVGNDGVANAQTCLNGFTVGTHNIDLLQLNGPKSTVRNVCMQMGSTGNRRSLGAAIVLGGTDQGHSVITGNTIFWPYDGIQVGRSSSDLVRASYISNNVIRSPIRYGIANGLGTTNGATVGHTYIDNQIGCDSGVNGIGFAFFDGAVVVDGTTNGPNNCQIGTAIIPGNLQNVNGEFRGVMGDANTLHDLQIAPVETGGVLFGGTVNFLNFTQAWASSVGNVNSVAIDCPANTLCSEIIFNGLTAHGGPGQTVPIVDIARDAGGPFNLTLSNSTICSFGGAGGGEVALRLNTGAAATQARWIINNNRIGAACGTSGTTPTPIGIGIIGSAGANAGTIVINGNDVSQSATPLSYTPAGEYIIVSNNLGIPLITSCTGWRTGTIWNNAGVVSVCP
jgi:hypothetical protein